MGARAKVAILGSGNIGTDLMVKIMRLSEGLEMAAMVGVDPASEGLARAERLGIFTTSKGLDGLLASDLFSAIDIVFDATTASAHAAHDRVLQQHGKRIIDLTPAALGPFNVPSVNGAVNLDRPNVNMVTCGGQATIPIVAAVNRISPVLYGEIVASIASRSAGPGTRANIDEFTETTARGLIEIGGAKHAKAIIILNPAEPPLVMRDTVYCLCAEADERTIEAAIHAMVDEVQSFVPGYRLKQAVQFERIGHNSPIRIPDLDAEFSGLKITVFLEVEGAAHYLPAYAGNLDIMTSAALRTAELIANRMKGAAS